MIRQLLWNKPLWQISGYLINEYSLNSARQISDSYHNIKYYVLRKVDKSLFVSASSIEGVAVVAASWAAVKYKTTWDIFVDNQLTRNTWVYFCVFYPVPLADSLLLCQDSTVLITIDLWYILKSEGMIFLFAYDCFGYLGSLLIPYEF
jgi:hypothetical protein